MATAPLDLLPLDDLAQRLRLSPKTLKRLGKRGLPLIRIMPPRGPIYGSWSAVARWILRHGETLSNGH